MSCTQQNALCFVIMPYKLLQHGNFHVVYQVVKSCLHCKCSAVKHISIDKVWNKQHRLGERRL